MIEEVRMEKKGIATFVVGVFAMAMHAMPIQAA